MVTCHVSSVTYHVTLVTCHMSHVICHTCVIHWPTQVAWPVGQLENCVGEWKAWKINSINPLDQVVCLHDIIYTTLVDTWLNRHTGHCSENGVWKTPKKYIYYVFVYLIYCCRKWQLNLPHCFTDCIVWYFYTFPWSNRFQWPSRVLFGTLHQLCAHIFLYSTVTVWYYIFIIWPEKGYSWNMVRGGGG